MAEFHDDDDDDDDDGRGSTPTAFFGAFRAQRTCLLAANFVHPSAQESRVMLIALPKPLSGFEEYFEAEKDMGQGKDRTEKETKEKDGRKYNGYGHGRSNVSWKQDQTVRIKISDRG